MNYLSDLARPTSPTHASLADVLEALNQQNALDKQDSIYPIPPQPPNHEDEPDATHPVTEYSPPTSEPAPPVQLPDDFGSLPPLPPGWSALAPPPEAYYDSMEDAIEAIHSWTKAHGYDVSKSKPVKTKRDKLLYRYLLRCTRCSKSKNTRKLKPEERRRTKRGSQKSNCPMGVWVCAEDRNDPQHCRWLVKHQERLQSVYHDHQPSHPTTMPNHRRRERTAEIKMRILELQEAGYSTARTLAILQQDYPDMHITSRDIYNERQQIRRDQRGERAMPQG
ncbi:hypothetical protein P152DRAFT_316037 [Eremomyces bilateralis CBS 781.70]|uniref:FAR1 domain-containing protein n=1 Tax=Eremomyces bilateralis CBS 781.70 TaxID=1392243 RepID=A0A6G1G669_9PEZI|nr:uncharacterized protein P152DRAFT_316037 [Eremomyces bilateralis CBS 781.70]KAF1813370.1 hypothetical protein P152DRAFT_316037 [Eremomyces bilateralis CBS 781.70]